MDACPFVFLAATVNETNPTNQWMLQCDRLKLWYLKFVSKTVCLIDASYVEQVDYSSQCSSLRSCFFYGLPATGFGRCGKTKAASVDGGKELFCPGHLD